MYIQRLHFKFLLLSIVQYSPVTIQKMMTSDTGLTNNPITQKIRVIELKVSLTLENSNSAD